MTTDNKLDLSILGLPSNAPLDELQKAWLGGYYAGIEQASKTFGATENTNAGEEVHILFGSQTGNAEGVAHDISDAIGGTVLDMGDVDADALKSFKNVIVVTSTYGDGEHPDNGELLWNGVQDIESLSFKYAVLGLGDTAYDFFCKSADDWDKFFESKGASRQIDTARLDVDYEEGAEEFTKKVAEIFKSSAPATAQPVVEEKAPAVKSKYTKSNPYMSELLVSKNLSGKDSSKQVYHFEFEVNDDDMQYEAGDALGVIPINDNALVDSILSAGSFDGSKIIDGKSLKDILTNEKEIRLPNKDFVASITTKSNHPILKSMANDKSSMDKFLWGRETIDFLNDYDVSYSEEEFLELLKPLQHRLYSISSSPKFHNGEVHLTVAKVTYDFAGRQCNGVASCFLADTLKSGQKVGLFVHPNKSFSVPQDGNAPIIMVGPGTGIAPFRAFIEERVSNNASGENWLFFGDRTQGNDFLYEDELKAWENDNKVKLSLAWSREENTPKTYVQDLMKKEGVDLFKALENGGYFYICGDASRMAKDVDATLIEVVATFGAMSMDKATAYVNNLKKEKRYVRDVY